MRIIDASINRAAEGLRVVEDYVRFALDDAHLTHLIKLVRHDLAEACSVWPAAELHAARETRHDVGTQISTARETQRLDATSVCAASFQRVKQSLRSLEETGKVSKPQAAAALESIRYRVYTLERCVTIAEDSRKRLEQAQLCILVDGRASETAFAELIRGLITAGVGMIQLRDKQLDDAVLTARARKLVHLVKTSSRRERSPSSSLAEIGISGTTLAIINDRPDIAAAAHADGVHLGQTDMRVKDARVVVGPRRLIGVSTHSIEQARSAVVDGANYLGVGPTFPSTTKSFDTYPGLKLLRQVVSEISLPAFAIGGIDAKNLGDVLATGIGHVAVSGAVVAAADPAKAAGDLLEALHAVGTQSPACAGG